MFHPPPHRTIPKSVPWRAQGISSAADRPYYPSGYATAHPASAPAPSSPPDPAGALSAPGFQSSFF